MGVQVGTSDVKFVDKTVTFQTAHGGVLHGAGTSTTKYTMTGASKSALSYYITTADTADSNRVAYLRLYLTGAAGGGEALRAYATASAAVSVVRGAHISVSYSGTSSCTGESMALKGTYHVPNSTLAGGTAAVFDAELYADGASSSLGSTELAMFRAHVAGNATGAAVVDAQAYMFVISGVTDGSAEFVRRAQNEPTWASKTCLIKCKINGNITYLVGVEL